MNEQRRFNKHAYLIIAHSNIFVLNKLISSVDDIRNDIFIHIDTKSKIELANITKPCKSNIKIFKKISVHWGHLSMIETELFLYESAIEFDTYSYFHLMSGIDLPIQNQNVIHDFFKINEGKEFIGFSATNIDIEKVNKIHLFSKSLRVNEGQYIKRLMRKLRTVFIAMQRIVKYDKVQHLKLEFRFGAVWTSLTHDLVVDLLRNKDIFFKIYKNSSCVDEIYKHTYVYNSKYKNNVYDLNDELNSCQRLMDWTRGNPYTFRIEDLESIRKNSLLFARKFDETIDEQVIEYLVEYNKLQ